MRHPATLITMPIPANYYYYYYHPVITSVLYANSARIYLQSMLNLEKEHPDVHQRFKDGFHVGRRSNWSWTKLSTDLMIEQVLMRSLKTSGGLTRGRGMTEQQQVIFSQNVLYLNMLRFSSCFPPYNIARAFSPAVATWSAVEDSSLNASLHHWKILLIIHFVSCAFPNIILMQYHIHWLHGWATCFHTLDFPGFLGVLSCSKVYSRAYLACFGCVRIGYVNGDPT